jgi:hypothetical protein
MGGDYLVFVHFGATYRTYHECVCVHVFVCVSSAYLWISFLEMGLLSESVALVNFARHHHIHPW